MWFTEHITAEGAIFYVRVTRCLLFSLVSSRSGVCLSAVAKATPQTLVCMWVRFFLPSPLICTVLSSLPQLQLALCQHSLLSADPQPFTVSSWTDQIWQTPLSPSCHFSLLLLFICLLLQPLQCVIKLSVSAVLFFSFLLPLLPFRAFVTNHQSSTTQGCFLLRRRHSTVCLQVPDSLL